MDHSKTTSGWLIVLSLLWLALIGGAVALALRARGGPAPGAYYATDQAHQGLVVYAQHCAECHGPALEGTSAPALVGEAFLDGWEGRSVEELFAYVRNRMPLGRGGTLSNEAYAVSTAYLLARNGFPGGEAALRVGDARLAELPLDPRFAGHEPEIPDVPSAPAEARTPARVPADAGSAEEGAPGGAGSPLRVLATVPVYLAQAQQEGTTFGPVAGEEATSSQEDPAQEDPAQEDAAQESAAQESAAQEDAGAGGGEAAGGDAAADGAAIYAQRCASCHGTEGGGGVGPALAGNAGLEDARAVVRQIVEGGGGMPSFGDTLANAEIAAVASHVRTQWGNAFGEVGTGLVAEVQGGGAAAGEDGGGAADGGDGGAAGGAGVGRPQADPQQDAAQDAAPEDETPQLPADGDEDGGEGGEGDPAAELPEEGAVAAGDEAGAVPGPDDVEELAAATYDRHCAACHGPEGGGGIGPALAENPRLDDDAWMIRRILVGGNAMPAFGAVLSSQGVAAVATHVRTRWGNDAGAVAPEAVEEVAADLSPGQLNPVGTTDLAQAPLGQQRFMQLCAACHGPQGGGDVGPPLAGNVDLANLQLVLSTIVNGRGIMPSFNHHTDEEIAAIASYVRTAWSNAFGPVDPAQVDRFRPRGGTAGGGTGDAGSDGASGAVGGGQDVAGGEGRDGGGEGSDEPSGAPADAAPSEEGPNTDDDANDEETP